MYLPYWDEILDISIKTRDAIWGVIEFRFWNPLKDIVLDLLNVRPRLLDPYALTNEETSLDNMLKDLGIGGKFSSSIFDNVYIFTSTDDIVLKMELKKEDQRRWLKHRGCMRRSLHKVQSKTYFVEEWFACCLFKYSS